MYCAKQRAVEPLSTVVPATEQVGSLMLEGSLDFAASALIAVGVMSGVPTICS